MSVELAAELPVPLLPAALLEPGALDALELGDEVELGELEALESLGEGEIVALPETLPEAPGVELAVLPVVPEVDVSVLDEDDALEVGGGVVGVTVVELLLLLVPLPFPVFGRSQPVTAAVANARTATTGMIFFMNFSNQDSVCGFDVNSSSCEGTSEGMQHNACQRRSLCSGRAAARIARKELSDAETLSTPHDEHAAKRAAGEFQQREIARRRARRRIVGNCEARLRNGLVQEGADPVVISRAEFAAFVAKETERWRQVVKESGAPGQPRPRPGRPRRRPGTGITP